VELRKLGHEAYSCDIEPCSGVHELQGMGKPSEIETLIGRLSTIIGELHAKLLPYTELGTVEELKKLKESALSGPESGGGRTDGLKGSE